MVSEFLEVFPDNILGMPPNQKFDFYIDLESGTSTIFIPLTI